MPGKEDSPLIVEEISSLFSSNTLKEFYSVKEVLETFGQPCGRFKSPLSIFDKLELHILKLLGNSQVFKNMAVIPSHTISPNWQVLLNYLYQKGIIIEPAFIFPPQHNDYPKLNKVSLISKFDSALTNAKSNTIIPQGYGAGLEVEEAYSKAVGELLERYFLSLYRKADFVQSSYNSLIRRGKRALDLNDLPSFLPWQKERFEDFLYTKDSLFHWKQVKELLSERMVYIPAQLIFWKYDFNNTPREPILRQINTNGEAGHFTFKESVLSAIYECVERDAFLLFWLNTIAPPILDIQSIDNTVVQKYIASLEQSGLQVYILDITTDIKIPTCLCVIVDRRGEEVRMAVGGSSGFTVQKNIIRSAMEAIRSMTVNAGAETLKLSKEYEPFIDGRFGQEERSRLWRGTEMYERFKFLISGKRISMQDSLFATLQSEFPSLAEEYEHVTALFRNKGKGYEIYCHTIQHPVLTRVGYYVTRVVIPQLMHLYLNEHIVTLGAQRLNEVPKKMGYTDTRLNPWPHPYP